MAAFAVEPQAPTLGSEPMMLGSPTSPKPGVNAQFLPGFLMGDLPAPVTPQPRSISGPSVGVMEMRSPLLAGGSPPQPVVPAHKDKSGAPPVRSIYDDISSPGLGSTPLTSRRQVIMCIHPWSQDPQVPVMGLASKFRSTTRTSNSGYQACPRQELRGEESAFLGEQNLWASRKQSADEVAAEAEQTLRIREGMTHFKKDLELNSLYVKKYEVLIRKM
nr:nucleoporin NUP35-like [Camelus dromedarius]